jgi:hypothetical protein
MYKSLPYFVLAFHGCDRAVADKILGSSSEHLKHSENDYDWLGNGIYFWENNPERALQYARHLKKHPTRGKAKILNEAVIGAVIDLGNCLNLLEAQSLQTLKTSYDLLRQSHKLSGFPLPENTKPLGEEEDVLIRRLDCAVVEMAHVYRESIDMNPFDTVRGVFWEGKELYPNAGFREKNHIQICVRNLNCIKGYFCPRKMLDSFPVP